MIASIEYIIEYIESLERVGADPFQFLDKQELINNYSMFKLIDIDSSSNLVNWENIEGYNPNPKSRILKKTTESNKDYFLNLYSNVTEYPVVLGYDKIIIDGSHRLANIKHNKLNFKAWIAI
tara:strand:- start:258 stop:623 length:366 start_codon:yes stop_codon:yes gene_type:complete